MRSGAARMILERKGRKMKVELAVAQLGWPSLKRKSVVLMSVMMSAAGRITLKQM